MHGFMEALRQYRLRCPEEVALVNVYAIARDPKGRYLTDLTAADFKIFENDHPQTIDRFSAELAPRP